MGLPQIIIAIILGVVLISMNSSFLGDTFSEGSARATSGTLISQGGQISEATDTYRALNSGSDPANLAALTANGEYLGSEPNTGISGVTWTVADLVGSSTTLSKIAMTTGTGLADAVCNKILEAAGATNPMNIPDGQTATEIESVIGEGLLYGCFNNTTGGGGDNIFYRR